MNLSKFFENRKFLVIHDYDCDGISSAAILMIYLKNNKKQFENISTRVNEKKEELIKLSKKYDSAIFLDLGYINEENIKAFKNVLIIDHHVPKKYDKNIIYINPRIENPKIYQPTSYITQKIFGNEKTEWISLIGIIGDMAFSDTKDILRKYKINQRNWEKKKIGICAKVLDAVKVIKREKGATEAANFIAENYNHGPNILIRKYSKEYKTYKNELKRLIMDFNKNKILIGKNFLFYEVKSKYAFSSTLATVISNRKNLKNKVLVIAQKTNEKIKVSLRGNITDLNDFAKRILIGLNGFGGGHPNAAGIVLNDEESYKAFLDRLKNFKL